MATTANGISILTQRRVDLEPLQMELKKTGLDRLDALFRFRHIYLRPV